MTPRDLFRAINELKLAAPITANYERALISRDVWSRSGVWYTSQQEHWLGWLAEYDGPGAYGRKTSKRRSAGFATTT